VRDDEGERVLAGVEDRTPGAVPLPERGDRDGEALGQYGRPDPPDQQRGEAEAQRRVHRSERAPPGQPCFGCPDIGQQGEAGHQPEAERGVVQEGGQPGEVRRGQRERQDADDGDVPEEHPLPTGRRTASQGRTLHRCLPRPPALAG